MTAVLIVLSLLVFAAGLVAWAVHMRGVWVAEAQRAARRGRAHRSTTDAPIDPAQTDDPVIEDSRP